MAIATEKRVIFSRVWEMPNANTFSIPAIEKLIYKYKIPGGISIDPFANKNKIADITNDLNPLMGTTHNMDALPFLYTFAHQTIDNVFFDPPYSSRQVAECYKKFDMTVNMETTQSSFWGNLKKQIAHILKPNGIVISCGWNSNGIGQTLGFEIVEIMLVAHGGAHNDTIVTVERKLTNNLF